MRIIGFVAADRQQWLLWRSTQSRLQPILAATNAAASIAGKIGEVLKHRECRRQLANNVWAEVAKRSNGRLRSGQGYLDPNALWEWVNQPEVHAALLAGDPAEVRRHGDSIRVTWRTSTYDQTNQLSDDDGQLAAELVFYLLVVDVLAGDELLRRSPLESCTQSRMCTTSWPSFA